MASARVLGTSMEQRIRNQIGRVFRNTFGAEQGLCALVELATEQMRTAGATRTIIHETLSILVREHPEARDATRIEDLAASVSRWSDAREAQVGTAKAEIRRLNYEGTTP